MAENYDGSVIIKTGLDLNTIEKDAETLKKAIDAATRGAKDLQSVAVASGKAQIQMLQQANAGWKEQLRILNKIRDAMGGATIAPMAAPVQQTATRTRTRAAVAEPTGPVETAEYAELRKQAEALDKAMDKTVEKIDKMVAIYGQAKVVGMRAFQSLQYDLNGQQEQYARVVDRMQELEMDGQKYVEVQEQGAEVTREETQEVGRLEKAYTALASVLNMTVTEAVRSTKTIHKHSALSLKNVMKYALGIRSMFFLVRRLRGVAKEALGVMAQYDPALNGVISDLMTSVKRLKADLGTMLQPLVQIGAPILTYIVDKVSAATREIAKFFAALAGQDYINVATVKAVDYADGLDKVTESANKASEALGGYDKLNVISQSGAGGNDAANNMKLTKDTVEYTKEALDDDAPLVKLGRRLREIFDWAWGKLQELKEWLLKQEWVQTIISNLKQMLDDPDAFLVLIGATLVVSKLASMITSAVSNALTLAGLGKLAVGVTVAILGYKLGEKIFNSFSEGFKDELGETVYNLLENPLEQFFENCIYTFKTIGEFFYGIWDKVIDYISDVFVGWSKAIKKANKESLESWKTTWNNIKSFFVGIYNSIVGTFKEVPKMFKDWFTAAATGVKNAWNGVKDWFVGIWTGIKNAFGAVGTWFTSIFASAWTGIKNAWSGVKTWFASRWTDIKNAFGNVGSWFSEKFTGAWKNVKTAFSSVKSFFSDKWADIKDVFSSAPKWFSDKFFSAWHAIKQEFSNVGSFFSGVWFTIKSKFTDIGTKVGEAVGGAFKKVINVVLETVERVLNTPIKAINALLTTINKVPGINIGKLDTLSLPRLAQGAVIPANKEFLAVLGDQKHGTNIEAPLDTIVEAMQKALATSGGTGAQQVNLYLGGKQVAKVIWDETRKEWQQTGRNPWQLSTT